MILHLCLGSITSVAQPDSYLPGTLPPAKKPPQRPTMALRRTCVAILLAIALGACGEDESNPAERPAEREAGSWRTWVLPSSSAIRVPPPPAAGSPAAERDAAELRKVVQSRTPEQEGEARSWGRGPVVRPWLDRSMDFVSLRPKDPPRASRAYALVAVAMEDAAVSAWHWKYEYGRDAPNEDALFAPAPDPSYPSEHAAMAGAASRVLAYAFPDQSAAKLEDEARRAADSRVVAGVAYPRDVEAGLALGHAVADRVIARAKRDGFTRKWDGRRPRGPGTWEPRPGSAGRPVQPLAGSWDTWVMRSGRQFRAPPPPRFGSARYREEAREVMQVKLRLTPEQKRLAKFWEGGDGTELPPGIWIRVMLGDQDAQRLSTPRSARLFALLTVAMADAGVASWDSKYTYWTTRPENAIRALGLDRTWQPYIPTPLFPAYVSGHATYSAAAGEVLAHLFPDRAEVWRAKGREAGLSRIWGGIHFRSDNVEGAKMGRAIGRLVVRRAQGDGAER